MPKILYIGRFELPDKEATANRVVANAKLLRELGYNVTLAGWSDEVSVKDGWKEQSFFGFRCFEKHKAKTSYQKYIMFSDASPELSLLRNEKFDTVIAYDFPAVAFKKLLMYCRKHNIKCYGDISEWYTNKNKNPLFRIVRAYDSYLRMKVLNKKTDGLIVISRYLENYYSEQKTVLIPPLVDKSDVKWEKVSQTERTVETSFIYAGWPSKTKERLDVLVSAVEEISAEHDIKLDIYGVTEQQFRSIYQIDDCKEISKAVCFHGRVTHIETIDAVKKADYAMIIRQSNRKNNAGFPSKLVESISCGTAVLTTDISNVKDYVHEGTNGYIVNINSLKDDMVQAIKNKSCVTVNSDEFDYHIYTEAVSTFLES